MESIIHIGAPSASFSCWESKIIYVHNFLELSDAKTSDNSVSSEFQCLGHDWEFGMCPGGCDVAEDGYVSVILGNWSSKKVTIDYEVQVKGNNERDSTKQISHGEQHTFFDPNPSGYV